VRRNLTVTLDEDFIARMDTVCNGVPRGKWLEQASEQFLLYMETADLTARRIEPPINFISVGISEESVDPNTSARVSPKLRSGIKPRPKGSAPKA
jgi:hypothetical protein